MPRVLPRLTPIPFPSCCSLISFFFSYLSLVSLLCFGFRSALVWTFPSGLSYRRLGLLAGYIYGYREVTGSDQVLARVLLQGTNYSGLATECWNRSEHATSRGVCKCAAAGGFFILFFYFFGRGGSIDIPGVVLA